MKYFHEISDKEYNQIFKSGNKVQWLLDNYKQPDWCSYPGALMGDFGCWSLVDKEIRLKISKDFCKNCDCFNQKKSSTKKLKP